MYQVVHPDKLFNYGIRQVKPQDVAYASEKGYRIKLFSRSEKIGDKIIGFVAPHLIESNHVAFQVDNEFNAVVVEASFSDRQLFFGKGAGSFPTASAVLSDVSAIQYDYKYEYRKAEKTNVPAYTDDFYLKIYLGASNQESLSSIPFFQVDELFQSEDYRYQTGWVKFSDLKRVDFNNQDDLFFAVLPDSFKIEL